MASKAHASRYISNDTLPMPDWGRMRDNQSHALDKSHTSVKREEKVGAHHGFKTIARWAVQALTPNGVVDSEATWHFFQTGMGIPTLGGALVKSAQNEYLQNPKKMFGTCAYRCH